MKYEVKKIDECERTLEVTLPSTEVTKKIEALFLKYQASAKLDGFRKGKVPMNIIKTRYGTAIQEEAINECIQDAYKEILEKEKFKPVSEVKLETKKFEPSANLTFKLNFEVMPELKIKDYKGIKVKQLPTDVTDEEINTVLLKLQNSKATYSPIVTRAASQEDMVIVDYDVLWEEKGVYRKEHISNYTVVLDDPSIPEEIKNGLRNSMPNDRKKVKFRYPMDIKDEGMRGKWVEYDFLVHEVKEKKLPELDDEFAKTMGFKSVEELKNNIKQAVGRDKTAESRSRVKTQIINSLIENNPFKPLNTLVNDYMESMLEQAGKKVDDKTKNQIEEIAIWRAKRDMILQQVSKLEKIELSPEELKTKLSKTEECKQMGYEKMIKDLKDKSVLTTIIWELTMEKTLDFLVEKAEITVMPQK